MADKLRILFLVAHPDDAEYHAGGLLSIYARDGHVVKIVSLTSGDAGHHEMAGPKLAARRREEAKAAGAIVGAEYETWEYSDGQLEPTLELRWSVIREIRSFAPDLVLTHRTNDYHPDHRAVGTVVADASYMVTVPAVAADTPILKRDPVVAFMPDRFTKPAPLQPDVVVDVGEHVEDAISMLDCHVSQLYEWLPFNRQTEDQMPKDAVGRRAWLKKWYLDVLRPQADKYRDALIKTYGRQRGSKIEYAEAFEISEYATQLDDALRRKLFYFLPS